MVTRITLVCHATTRALRAATFGGDDAIDDVGRRNAERLRGRLKNVARCYVSPALRARETAEAMGLADPSVDERLRDCDFGKWTGLKFNQVLVRQPHKLFRWIKDPASNPHGGETIPQVMERVSAWIADAGKQEGHTVAVTHAAVIRAAIVYVIQAQLPSFWRIDVVPLSATDLRTNGRRWVLRSTGPMISVDEGE
jgi:broad specificity phosphatase PhoE